MDSSRQPVYVHKELENGSEVTEKDKSTVGYLVRRKTDGLYRVTRGWNRWGTRGQVYFSLSGARQAVSRVVRYGSSGSLNRLYDNYEVVQVELLETAILPSQKLP